MTPRSIPCASPSPPALPRYGTAPSDLATYYHRRPIGGATEKGGMTISLCPAPYVPSSLHPVPSPCISADISKTSQSLSAFNPRHAIAFLGQTPTELGSDSILLVKCADLGSPRALLEQHTTKTNSRALMLTLVPKFTLPSGPKPEIVFVVDRSGSMSGRMELSSVLALILALHYCVAVGNTYGSCRAHRSASVPRLHSRLRQASEACPRRFRSSSLDGAADHGWIELSWSIQAVRQDHPRVLIRRLPGTMPSKLPC